MLQHYVDKSGNKWFVMEVTDDTVKAKRLPDFKPITVPRQEFEAMLAPATLSIGPGSVVELKSGSAPMTVLYIYFGTVYVAYEPRFGDDGSIRKAEFPSECLQEVKSDANSP